MMKGSYRFYQDGALVGEVENLITTAGKIYIMKYLAGYVQSIAQGLAIGLGATAATVADTSLAFEWSRVPILMTSADYANTAIIFRGQIPVSYTHLRAHETDSYLVCRLLLEKK